MKEWNKIKDTLEDVGEGALYVILFIAILALLLGAEFLIMSGLYWLVCWAFNLTFSWKIAIGVYALLYIIRIGLGLLFRGN